MTPWVLGWRHFYGQKLSLREREDSFKVRTCPWIKPGDQNKCPLYFRVKLLTEIIVGHFWLNLFHFFFLHNIPSQNSNILPVTETVVNFTFRVANRSLLVIKFDTSFT